MAHLDFSVSSISSREVTWACSGQLGYFKQDEENEGKEIWIKEWGEGKQWEMKNFHTLIPQNRGYTYISPKCWSPNAKVPDPTSNVAVTHTLHVFPTLNHIILIVWEDIGSFGFAFITSVCTLMHCSFINSLQQHLLTQGEFMLLSQEISFWDSEMCSTACAVCGIYTTNTV